MGLSSCEERFRIQTQELNHQSELFSFFKMDIFLVRANQNKSINMTITAKNCRDLQIFKLKKGGWDSFGRKNSLFILLFTQKGLRWTKVSFGKQYLH